MIMCIESLGKQTKEKTCEAIKNVRPSDEVRDLANAAQRIGCRHCRPENDSDDKSE